MPYGTLTGCLKTEDRSALDRGTLEQKFYCPQLGFVPELATSSGERLELVEATIP